MNIKRKILKSTFKMVKKHPVGHKAIKTVGVTGFIVGGSFLTYVLASHGKNLSEQNKS